MAITNGRLFVVVLLHANMGRFIGRGVTLLAALGVIVHSHVGHQQAAARVRNKIRDLKNDLRNTENGLKNWIGRLEERITIKANGINNNLVALGDATNKVLEGDKKVAGRILKQIGECRESGFC